MSRSFTAALASRSRSVGISGPKINQPRSREGSGSHQLKRVRRSIAIRRCSDRWIRYKRTAADEPPVPSLWVSKTGKATGRLNVKERNAPALVWPPALKLPVDGNPIVYLDLNHWISLAKAAVG